MQEGKVMEDVTVTFRHLESSTSLRDYAVDKVSRVNKYIGGRNEISMVLSSEKHRFSAEITLQAKRITINAKEETDDMYSAIDMAVDKLERQIKKHKEKLTTHKVNTTADQINDRYDVLSSKGSEGSTRPRIVRAKNIFAKPMSLEEAVEQLELLNNEFLVFINVSSGKVSVIYHRKDGDYGLIEPDV
jgi:putative sigma-54 modulation protein